MGGFEAEGHARRLLQALQQRGFQHAQVRVSQTERCELNVAHNEPSLLRSTTGRKVSASGIVDGRRASTEGSDLGAEGMVALVDELWASAQTAPRDEAHAVSEGQVLRVVRGPRQADSSALAAALRALLDWRAAHAPSVMIEEALAAHVRERFHLATSGGSAIDGDLGWCEMSVFGLAREGQRASSFNYTGGECEALADVPRQFGVDHMMRELTRQVDAQPIGGRFEGEVVLAPMAVQDLLAWLMDQLSDGPLIEGSSLYRERVGQPIASPLLTLHSRYDAPGCLPVTADAFIAPAVTLLDAGRLTQLAPSLYGSRKTGLPHRPLAASGWALQAGATPLAEMIAAVPRGALVGRLSMGRPAPDGGFAGVVKNSFVIEGGRLGPALRETMIHGNVATMLREVSAVSAERLDTGSQLLPWLRVPGLGFS